MPAVLPELFSAACIKKMPEPIMKASDLPYPCSLVFNAGVIKYKGEYVMIFRNDYGADREAFEKEGKDFTGTSIGIARSKNGVDGWVFDPLPIIDSNDPNKDPELRRYYDPRIIEIEGKLYLCLAMSTQHGICGAIAELSDDLPFDQPQRTRQSQYGAVSGKDQRGIRPLGTPDARLQPRQGSL